MERRRAVVTGLGIISPVGNTVDEAWKNVVEGRPGMAPITDFDPEPFATRFAGLVKDFDPEAHGIPKKEARKIDTFVQYGVAACNQALAASGLEVTDDNRGRIGVAMGAGIGGIATIEANHEKYLNQGPRRISPFFIPGAIINMISGHVSIMHGLTGPNLAVVTACTTSTHSIGLAARSVAWGDADVMLAGGAEYATTPLGLGGFCAARALSTRNDEPQRASRPFDRDRDGFVLADGAGCLVIEEYEHAKARGASILAEVVGFGMSGDASHITLPPEDGEGARKSMAAALGDAGLNPDDVDHLNGHATSTIAGDIAETVAVKRCFGDHAASLPVSATKSTTGHLLGAAGAVEAIFSILAIRDQVLPPTINLDNPDPQCDLDYVPNTARDAKLQVAMSNSFGFGGTNGTLIFRAV
ncbi:beta-ketoacyl-ACP synthase II [Lentisalinibacter sediminis]|uniref:beta-ketoacyl-ACP synthase II n=1 Tax=Lentisalinibacter sediminis TaxID=2992237 RepID=UPI00386E7A96